MKTNGITSSDSIRFFGTTDIKHFVELALREKSEWLKGKIVVDVPAGSGYSTRILQQLGADVEAYDLFPEFFAVDGLTCTHADLGGTLPIPAGHADMVLCQEGIEHLTDQLKMLTECSRILKKGGTLLLTTPNESNLRMRLSMFLSESEYAYKMMPPNELDSVWFSGDTGPMYFGHIALIGIMKLRMLARMAGFRITRIRHMRVNTTSLVLMPFLYPFILLANIAGYYRAMRNNDIGDNAKRTVYGEILRLSIDPKILVDGHLFIEFEKEFEPGEAARIVKSKYTGFDVAT